MNRFVLVSSAALVLVASGIVHGIWTDRWSSSEDLAVAAERLKQIPMNIGGWQGSDFEQRSDPRLGFAGTISRRYVNVKTNAVVSVYLACGRPGPVCVHTPDVCYAGIGFQAEKPARFQVPGTDGAPEFWTARFTKTGNDGQNHLRIFWAWHGADGWRVADNPRLTFAGEPKLHKLYVIREMAGASDPLDTDPAVEFMQELLPTLQAALFTEEVN